MTTQIDTLIAAALEREQMAIRAAQEQRRREDEQLAEQWRADLLILLDAALSAALREALNLTIQTTRNGAWAEFTYADRQFNLQRTSAGGGDILCLKLPGENGLLQIGHIHPSVGKLDETLLQSLGHWRERHGVEAIAMPTEEEQLADIPF